MAGLLWSLLPACHASTACGLHLWGSGLYFAPDHVLLDLSLRVSWPLLKIILLGPH